MKKFTAFIAVIMTALSISSMPALSAGVEMDENGDNIADIFDMIIALQKNRPEHELKNVQIYSELHRKYNYFESDSMGAGSFTFRITDIYGRVVIDENIPLSYDNTEIIQGHVRFPK